MLLRRITQHVKDQNWFAVFVDFVIVVIGVFIGIQVANWNETRTSKVALQSLLGRLTEEVSQNIRITSDILGHYEEARPDMVLGRETLSSCNFTPEGQAALERMMFDLTNDVLPNFVSVAQDQLARQSQYQVHLSKDFQSEFAAYSASLSEEYEQLSSHYRNLWSFHVNHHPSLDAFFSGEPGASLEYQGWGYRLNVPFDEVCKDTSFRLRFINTIGFYSSIEVRLNDLLKKIQTFQTALAKELDNY